jgi:hypothetical protein
MSALSLEALGTLEGQRPAENLGADAIRFGNLRY